MTTLVVCKPVIRKSAKVGDLVIGCLGLKPAQDSGFEHRSIRLYVAPTMAQIPCALHGSNIEQVEFYLTADGRPIDLQGGVFSATLLISWPDPGVPQAGSAGAYDVIANAQNVYRR